MNLKLASLIVLSHVFEKSLGRNKLVVAIGPHDRLFTMF